VLTRPSLWLALAAALASYHAAGAAGLPTALGVAVTAMAALGGAVLGAYLRRRS
jgi:hypothetical protein